MNVIEKLAKYGYEPVEKPTDWVPKNGNLIYMLEHDDPEHFCAVGGSVGVVNEVYSTDIEVDFFVDTLSQRYVQLISRGAILNRTNYAGFLVPKELVAPCRIMLRTQTSVPLPDGWDENWSAMEMLGKRIDTWQKWAYFDWTYYTGRTDRAPAVWMQPDYDWMDARDKTRFTLGWWVSFDVIEQAQPYHSLHVQKASIGTTTPKVAYFASEYKRQCDVCTVSTIGRYLSRFYPDLSDYQVRELVDKFTDKFGALPEVKFSDKADDFVRAINYGPSESCMAGLDYKGHEHPAVVYAYGDISVAWTERNGVINARTLVNKKTREFSRVYGDQRLKHALIRLGYRQEVGALIGCRLLKIENEFGPGFLMPYVDAGVASHGGSLAVTDEGEYWRLGEHGLDTYVGYEYAGVTEGVSDDTFYCDECDSPENSDNMMWVDSTNQWVCMRCLDSRFTYAGTRIERGPYSYHVTDFKYFRGTDYCGYSPTLDEYCTIDALEDAGFIEVDGEWYPPEKVEDDVTSPAA